MRFEKEGDFVEISEGLSCDYNGNDEVWFVESNLEFKDLPIKFRVQVQKSNLEATKELQEVVSSWAKRNYFKLKIK